MSGLLLGGAVLIAIALVIAARFRKKRVQDQLGGIDGYSVEHPRDVASYDEVDGFLRQALCPECGKRALWRVGEDTTSVQGRALYVVRSECSACEVRTALWFDVAEVPN